jgi:hypothetical protein
LYLIKVVEMPTNTDNSGTARAARLRRIVASRGPTPAHSLIGSQALDAQLGKLECCPFNWTGSPLQLAYQKTVGTDLFFTAVFANADGSVVPQFGLAVPSSCGSRVAAIETLYSNTAGALSVTYKISTGSGLYIPATITQLIGVTCEGVTYERTITFLVPEDYRTAC